MSVVITTSLSGCCVAVDGCEREMLGREKCAANLLAAMPGIADGQSVSITRRRDRRVQHSESDTYNHTLAITTIRNECESHTCGIVQVVEGEVHAGGRGLPCGSDTQRHARQRLGCRDRVRRNRHPQLFACIAHPSQLQVERVRVCPCVWCVQRVGVAQARTRAQELPNNTFAGERRLYTTHTDSFFSAASTQRSRAAASREKRISPLASKAGAGPVTTVGFAVMFSSPWACVSLNANGLPSTCTSLWERKKGRFEGLGSRVGNIRRLRSWRL